MQSSLARFTAALSTLALGPLFMLSCASLPAHAGTAARTTSNAPIPIGDFFNNSTFSGAVMSPDGRHLAVLVSAKGGRVQLYTVELAGMKVSGLTSFEDADIAQTAWVNDQRIVYSVADHNIAEGDVRHGPGLYAINLDGSNYRQLASNTSTNRTATGSHIGRALRDAVSKTNRDVEWVVYQEEGHGWALPKNNIDFWTRAEKLLQRSIGSQAAQ